MCVRITGGHSQRIGKRWKGESPLTALPICPYIAMNHSTPRCAPGWRCVTVPRHSADAAWLPGARIPCRTRRTRDPGAAAPAAPRPSQAGAVPVTQVPGALADADRAEAANHGLAAAADAR